MDLQILRRETAADHVAVEGSVPLMHDTLDKAQYISCLQRIYGVVAAWEEVAPRIAPTWLQPTLAARQRKPLLELDLAWFGETAHDESRPTLPDFGSVPSLLGAMYVMEGSTLGGQFIARHVESKLHLSDGNGNAYFRGYGQQTGPMWKEFCEILKTTVPDVDTPLVISSAKAMFAVFGAWMQQESAVNA